MPTRAKSLNPMTWFFGFLVFLKLFLMFKVPIVSDEAYYIFWGTHPAGGYYDLPPMIGWWESLFARVSLHPFWLRIPNLFVTVLVALGIHDVLKPFGRDRARWVSMIYFILPVHLLSVLISPDVPLVFFTFFAAMLFYFSDVKKSSLGYFSSGALWGAAFLSKYFAVMLVPAILIWFFIARRSKEEKIACWKPISLLVLGAAPFLFQHLWWNSKNCWANFVFNLVSRQGTDEGPVYQTFGFYLLYLLILITPFFLKDLFKSPEGVLNQEGKAREFFVIDQEAKFRTYVLLMWVVPISLFGVTALLARGQGLHWYLSYMPFLMLWFGLKLSTETLKRRLKQLMVLTGVIVIPVSVLLCAPGFVSKEILHGRHQLDLQTALNGKAVAEKIAPFVRQSQLVVANGYVYSSILDMQLRRYSLIDPKDSSFSVAMWGSGSRFGRVFDWTSHLRSLDGRTFVLVSSGPPDGGEFSRYFVDVRTEKLLLDDFEFYVSLGFGFRAELYQQEKVIPALNQFYPEFRWVKSVCPLK